MLQSVRNHVTGDWYKSGLHFVTYSTGRNTHPFRDKSGAYIFLPDGVAKVVYEDVDSINQLIVNTLVFEHCCIILFLVQCIFKRQKKRMGNLKRR